MPILELKTISKNFGKLQACSKVDMVVNEGEIHSLIGPNGAGKSTLFNVITGTYRASSGNVIFKGMDITALPPYKIAKLGLVRSFQQTYLFQSSSVLDNVLMGFHMGTRAGAVQEFLHTPLAQRKDRKAREEALDIIELMGLSRQKDEMAKNLPHGHQRCLGMSIALACKPKLILLDEPVTGMNPSETIEMVERIRKIREKGVTVVLVEHSMKVVMDVSDRITVLSFGQKIAEGLPDEIKNNPQVIEAYLGKEDAWNAA